MLISEAIDCLEAALSQAGDIDICIDVGNVDEVFEVCGIWIENSDEENTKRLIFATYEMDDRPVLRLVKGDE